MADLYNIAGRINSTSQEQVAVVAEQVLAGEDNKKQSQVNSETAATLNEHNNRLNAMSEQNYVTVTATDATADVTTILPATGTADTIYRVGKWDGTAYNPAAYAEYAWNGSAYVLLDVKNPTLEPLVGYYTCGIAAGTAAKEVTAPNYVLTTGGSIKIKMTNANTADNATLNINGTGAKALFYDGEQASSSNSWEAGEIIEVFYDGTRYQANNVAGGGGDGVFDVSAEFPTGGVNGGNTYTFDGAVAKIPATKQKGGMKMMFIQSSDNKYVQFRYMLEYANTTAGNQAFLNTANWQGVDDVPTAGSDNLVKSGGIYNKIQDLKLKVGSDNTFLFNESYYAGIYLSSDGVVEATDTNDGLVIQTEIGVTYNVLSSKYSQRFFLSYPTIGNTGTGISLPYTAQSKGYILISFAKAWGPVQVQITSSFGITKQINDVSNTQGLFSTSSTFGFDDSELSNIIRKSIKKIELTDTSLINNKKILRAFGISQGSFVFYINDTTNINDDVTPDFQQNVIDYSVIQASEVDSYIGIQKINGVNGKISIFVDFSYLKNNPIYAAQNCCYNNSSINNFSVIYTSELETINGNISSMSNSITNIEAKADNLYEETVIGEEVTFNNGLISFDEISLENEGDYIEFDLITDTTSTLPGFAFCSYNTDTNWTCSIGLRYLQIGLRTESTWLSGLNYSSGEYNFNTQIEHDLRTRGTVKVIYENSGISVYINNVQVKRNEYSSAYPIIKINRLGKFNLGGTDYYWSGTIYSFAYCKNGNITTLLSSLPGYTQNSGITVNQVINKTGKVAEIEERVNTLETNIKPPIIIVPQNATTFFVKVLNNSSGKYLTHTFNHITGSHEVDGVTYNNTDVWTSLQVLDGTNEIYQGNLNMIYKIGEVNGVSASDNSVNEDYHVGISHGNEAAIFTKFFADGKEFTPTSIPENGLTCSKFRFITKTKCYVVDSSQNTGNAYNFPKIVDGNMVVHGIHYIDAEYSINNKIKWYNRLVQLRDASIKYKMLNGGMVQGKLAFNNNILLNDINNCWNEVNIVNSSVEYTIPSEYDNNTIIRQETIFGDAVNMWGDGYLIHQKMINKDTSFQSHSTIYTNSNDNTSAKCYMQPVRTTYVSNPDTFNEGDIIAVYIEREIEVK